MKYQRPKAGEWIQPRRKGYKLACCDCGLVHTVDFRIHKGKIQFIQADALTVPLDGYDFIWASPPCQAFALAALSHRLGGKEYPNLVAAVREMLLLSDAPFVIENTPSAPLRVDLLLCGSMFGLEVIRHRIFEMSFGVCVLTPMCRHSEDPITVCGHGTPSWIRARRGKNFTQQEKRDAMGIQWMNRGELAESIPPAYSEFIGKQALAFLGFKPDVEAVS